MTPSEISANRGLVSRLVAILNQYEIDVATMVQVWPPTASYVEVSRGFDAMRACSHDMPSLSVPLLYLFLAHSELIAVLWSRADPDALEEVREVHTLAVRTLRRQCLRALLASPPEVPTPS